VGARHAGRHPRLGGGNPGPNAKRPFFARIHERTAGVARALQRPAGDAENCRCRCWSSCTARGGEVLFAGARCGAPGYWQSVDRGRWTARDEAPPAAALSGSARGKPASRRRPRAAAALETWPIPSRSMRSGATALRRGRPHNTEHVFSLGAAAAGAGHASRRREHVASLWLPVGRPPPRSAFSLVETATRFEMLEFVRAR